MSDDFPHSPDQLAELAQQILALSREQGASDAQVVVSESLGQSFEVRQGRVNVRRREVQSQAHVVFYRQGRQGSAFTSDLAAARLTEAVRAAADIASCAAEDPHAGPAEAMFLTREVRPLDIHHPWALAPEKALEAAAQIESGIASAGARVISDGVRVGSSQGRFVMASSQGFCDGFAHSMHWYGAKALAGAGSARQVDHWHHSARHADDLQAPAWVGARAGRGALSYLDARSLSTRRCAVLFSPQAALSLLEHCSIALGGPLLASRSSFLLDSLGKSVWAEHVDLIDDPFIPRGLASAPFDADGMAGSRRSLVCAGVVQGYLLSCYTARRLGMAPTGNANGCYNLRLASRLTRPGDDFAQMLRKLDRGLLVTGFAGEGVRLVNGDYSRAVKGFWVENGELSHAVHQVTLAGNLADVFKGVAAVGDDVLTQGNFSSGSVLIEDMQVVGNRS